jgi:hypothetical protein
MYDESFTRKIKSGFDIHVVLCLTETDRHYIRLRALRVTVKHRGEATVLKQLGAAVAAA